MSTHRVHVPPRAGLRQGAAGVASLTVVMMLFLVLAMVVAYTGRNLVFEQRTAVNQLRSTQAIETAQAGLEWAIAMLNGGRINATCQASALPADTSFRQRYLNIDTGTGRVTRRVQPTSGSELWPSCVLGDTGWTCSCPSDAAPALTAPGATEVRPAFRVRFVNEPNNVRGLVAIQVNGCTRLDDACLNFPSTSVTSEGRSTISALVALKSAAVTPPVAAVTTRLAAAGDLRAVNTNAEVGAVTVQSGLLVTIDDSRLQSAPGTPGERSKIENDPSLADASLPANPFAIGDRMFASVFGMWPQTYRDQPAAVALSCGLAGCSSAVLRAAVANNPGRPIWASGNVVIDDALDIGTATEPFVLIIEGGTLNFAASGRLYALVYGSRAAAAPGTPWSVSGGGRIVGALMSEHALLGAGDPVVSYDRSVMTLLRLTHGSFVLVPGSWKDF